MTMKMSAPYTLQIRISKGIKRHNRMNTHRNGHLVSVQRMGLCRLAGYVKIGILEYHARLQGLPVPCEGSLGCVELAPNAKINGD